MPPHRSFTDLCLISVFKQLTPNEQMKASRMSPRCLLLVRATNRRLKSLLIRTQNTNRRTEHMFKPFFFSKHCMQLIEGSVPFARYLLKSRTSKWNCLLLWDAVKDERESPSTIADQIVYIFSAVIDFKLAATDFSEECEIVAKLLQHPHWAGQLTDLGLTTEHRTYRLQYDFNLACRVTAALNGLSALQLLSIDGFANLHFSKLTILAQLKAIAVNYEHRYSTPEGSFLRSFQRQSSIVTQKQPQQQVYLIWKDDILRNDYHMGHNETALPDLLSLSELELSRIVGLHCLYYEPEQHDTVLRLCTKLTSLVSLTMFTTVDLGPPLPTTSVQFFKALSQLKQLIYLDLIVSFEESFQSPPQSPSSSSSSPPLPPQPLSVQLFSVRALCLLLTISSHAQVKWLNLTQRLPNCQVIEFSNGYTCSACNVELSHFTEGLAHYHCKSGEGVHRNVALNCLRTTLSELHQGVHPSKLIFKYGCPTKESSLEQLLMLQ